MSKNVVVVDGVRTPFLKYMTDFAPYMSYQLGQQAIKGLLEKTGIDKKEIGRVVMGTVAPIINTPNLAREAAVTAGIDSSTPCHTVSMACISANQAISTAADAIKAGHADVIIAGGTECPSDTPIGYSKKMRRTLIRLSLAKTMGQRLGYLGTMLNPVNWMPAKPAIAEFLTKKTMGADCEEMVQRYKVGRKEQDEFAVRSHVLAAKAHEGGLYKDEIVSVEVPPKFKVVSKDNGVRGNSTVEKAAKLRPAFDKKNGSLTAANSSFLTDGAAVVLLMSEDKAAELGYKPKARIHTHCFSAQRLEDELLLGPTYAISQALSKSGLSIDDIGVWEIHEAFAGQVLTNLKCLADDEFCKQNLGRDKAVGQIPMDKINTLGGSLSIGHPFGATGARLVTTCANRMNRENAKYGVIAACAAGAHGHAMILENINQ
jgi:acetyl-CoA acetyltransferase family protein